MLNRRHFTMAVGSLAFAGLAKNVAAVSGVPAYNEIYGYGPLQKDPNGLLNLPKGFSYKVISQYGDLMDDGFQVPDRADGMGCIPLSGSQVALVRNHELKIKHGSKGPFANKSAGDTPFYDNKESGSILPGGTTTIIYDMATGQRVSEHLSLVGTIRNCAGGVTPWGSWLTCEEDVSNAGDDVDKDHGWVFEVPADAKGVVDPVPLKALGRFNHEAAAIDPNTGIVYLTEDRGDSLFYRFIPNEPGKLLAGGKLQALGLKDTPKGADTRNWEQKYFTPGTTKEAFWIDLDDTDSPNDDLRERGHANGAAIFARGEGIHWGNDELFFCCTSGGDAELGQIMRYRPSPNEGLANETDQPGVLELFVESTNKDHFDYGDNLTVAPNGHLIVCEDQYGVISHNHLRGVTPNGKLYTLGFIDVQTEPAGACFSPDGSTLFVNLYSPTKTLAITGPWDSFHA